MPTHTTDIDTAAVPAPAPIHTLDELTAAVAKAAQLQLVIMAAEARQRAAVEAAKEAFELATRASSAELAALLAGISAAADAHKDDWFPIGKNKKRKKSLKVLEHTLAYRQAVSVEAPAGAAQQLTRVLQELAAHLASDGLCAEEREILEREQRALSAVLRQPPVELNKEAVKALDENALGWLYAHGVKLVSTESFTLRFDFTPNA